MSIGKGFTLVEMIVVVAVVSLLSVSFVGGYHYVAKQEMLQVTQEVQMMIQVMQQKAALRNGTYKLKCYEVDKESLLTVSANGREELSYKVPKRLMVYIGSGEDYFQVRKIICFPGDVSPSESGTLTVWHKQIPYHTRLTVQPVTGVVTIYPIEKNPGGKSFEEYISSRLYGVW